MKYIQLKHEAFDIVPAKPEGVEQDTWDKVFSIDYRTVFDMALHNKQVVNYADIKRVRRLLTDLKRTADNEYWPIDDENLPCVQDAVTNLTFSHYDEALARFSDAVDSPLSEKPDA